MTITVRKKKKGTIKTSNCPRGIKERSGNMTEIYSKEMKPVAVGDFILLDVQKVDHRNFRQFKFS